MSLLTHHFPQIHSKYLSSSPPPPYFLCSLSILLTPDTLPPCPMSPLLFFFSFFFFTLGASHSLPRLKLSGSVSNERNDKCGSIHIPFPFHLNSSSNSPAWPSSDAFRLSCVNSTTLFLNIASNSYRVLQFFSDGILVDFPGATSCRQYNDLNSFRFSGNDHFGISIDNFIGLYDCEDSSLCRADCEINVMPACDSNGNGNGNGNGNDSSRTSPACCYALSDGGVWQTGNGFSVFSQFGCRGFSCWLLQPGTNQGKRGVKLEWAVPKNSSQGVCAINAFMVNATSVQQGIRCMCRDGFVGDGFAHGLGCSKSCIKDGREANGKDCNTERRNEKKVVILAGVLAPVFIIASLIGLFCLFKWHVKSGTFDPDQAHYQSTISFRKACRTQLFTFHELEEATRGFEDGQKLVDSSNGTLYSGVLGDGSHVAVHKVQCGNERDLIQVLSRVEVLSAVLHRNMARLLGCCIDSGYTALAVYEYPANGTLEEHLHQSRGKNLCLDWYKRLKIAAETASILSFLQHEISPPIFHHDLKSGCIFLDHDFSIKIAGFGLPSSALGDGTQSYNSSGGSCFHRNDVYNLGVVLLEIIAGSRVLDPPTVALQKIGSGKLEEIVDPVLYYHEQPPFRREQIEIVADLATRCLLFGGDGKLGTMDVTRELVHMMKESMDGCSKRGPALEETFSNSSLLQMISMSPDSI